MYPHILAYSYHHYGDIIDCFVDLCVGSEEETDDIIPCTWVGYNMSGSAEIRDGALWINGKEVRKLSDLKPYQDYSNPNYTHSSNSFTMPVGQQMYVTMRLCNEAMLCRNKSLGVVVVTNSDSVIATSTNGSAIEERLTITSRKRAAAELDIRTPGGQCQRVSLALSRSCNSVYCVNKFDEVCFMFDRSSGWAGDRCDSTECI